MNKKIDLWIDVCMMYGWVDRWMTMLSGWPAYN